MTNSILNTKYVYFLCKYLRIINSLLYKSLQIFRFSYSFICFRNFCDIDHVEF